MRLFLRFGGDAYYPAGGFYDNPKICDTLADALNTSPDGNDWQQVCLIDNGQPYVIAHTLSYADGTVEWVIDPNGTIKLTAQEHVYLLAHRRLGDNP